jgi:beta-N-acetylhexosaminidase
METTMTLNSRIDQLLDKMTLEQKIGQMLALGFSGTYPHPDILRMIEQYHVAGFRVTPSSRKFIRELKEGSPGEKRVRRAPEPDERSYGANIGAPHIPAAEYARVLNVLRQRSLETGAGIPLYFALDFEGNQSIDYYAPGMSGFPHPMGLAQSGDPTLTRRVARSIGKQLGAVGINWIHSPVLDVNTDPTNPEINTRSYSSLPEVVAEYGLQALQGFDDANVIATGKHFPGRGQSSQDAHFDVAVICEDGTRMREVHFTPYRALIQAGLPAIMLAHSIFPALDPSMEIATLSATIINDILRGELGFKGVVMTDSFTMGGLANRYEIPDAAVRAVQAGVDLILLKDENALRGEVHCGLLDAVRTGTLNEDRVTDSVRRVLRAKERIGLLDGNRGIVDLNRVDEIIGDPEHAQVAGEAAAQSVVVLRQAGGDLPIKPGARVLVVEEVCSLTRRLNDPAAYPGALYHALLENGVDAVFTDFDADSFDKAWPIISRRASDVDLVVHTGFYERAGRNAKALHARFASLGKPEVFVTNSPYPLMISPEMTNVVVTFSAFAVSMQAAADVLCGKRPARVLRFDPDKAY